MLKISKEKMLERLNAHTRQALQRASELCIENSGYEVLVSHYLLALLDQPANDLSRMLIQQGCDIQVWTAKLRKSLDYARRGARELPYFSPMLLELLQDAFLISTAELGEKEIRSGAVLIACARNPDRYCHFHIFPEFEALDAAAMTAGFKDLTRSSLEGEAREEKADAPLKSESALQKFGRNITAEAQAGRIDPVFCREAEIALMTDVLCRRRKNNPILVGDPGVGKTAVAEGLALKIIENDVPDALRGAVIWELNLGALQAGASVKGEFERRLKAVLDEILNSAEKIILFIDEAHTLIGGGQAGGSDAANLLKPALARGQLRAIAATTWSEYKKYFEKDPALTRRFQLVRLEEPTPQQAITILRGLRGAYEETHGVYITDAALRAAAELSARYLTGRQLPDKAFDVLDTACVRVASGQAATPVALDLLHKRIRMEELAMEDAARDRRLGAEGLEPESDARTAELTSLREEAERLEARWAREKALVADILEARRQLNALEGPDGDPDMREKLQKEIADAIATLRLERGNEPPLVNFEVGAAVIGQVVSDWTGVPAANMSDDDAERLLLLGDRLRAAVLGQDEAIAVIHDRLKAARLDFVRQNTPRGVFLLVGPSGVGKTETAEQVAKLLYGGRQFLTVINMSEYQEKHTVSRLIGSPPGYVGYGEGGVLTEAIRRMPYSVVLLDEVEKAHPEVMNLFYQVFDKGVLNDGEGREIDCRNAVFFITSNLGSSALMQNRETVAGASMEALEAALRPHLEPHFKPALLARMRILCFKPLSDETIRGIINLKLTAQAARLREARGLELVWDTETESQIAALCAHADNGARMAEQVIERWILPPVAEETLTRLSQRMPLERIEVTARDGGFQLTFLPEYALDEAA
ncbi:MAG: type VI secretion system ATPase TssH [Rhizobiaceae bacterium]|nr:type VI secretion system ATPase TssH [Rhizobiaceae bacterium]